MILETILAILGMTIFIYILPITLDLIQDGKKWSALAMFAFLYIDEVCLIYIGCNI